MMSLGRTVLVWIARHALALVLILLILIVGRYALAPAARWVKAELAAARGVPAQRAAYGDAQASFADYARSRRAEAEAATRALPSQADSALRQRLAAIDPAIERERGARLGTGQLALAAATGKGGRLFAHYRAGAEIALLERERRYIEALLAARAAGGAERDRAARRAEAVARLHASYAAWRAANERVQALNRRPLAPARNFVCRETRPRIGCENYRALAEAQARRDAALAVNRLARATIGDIDRAGRAIRAAQASAEQLSSAFDVQRQALAGQLAAVERRSGENWLLWVRQPIVETLPTALLILAAAMFGPALIKAFLYFVVAPAAARRPPVRLVPGERGATALAGASAVSQRVAVEPGRELLVLPEAVQSTSHEAAKATQWLLSWAMPLSSLAAGMVALIRVRPARSDFVLVSATRNSLAEVAVIEIGEGSAMVLRPRALRGLVQPLDRPMRITRHWRLGHLSAWLTLQFRYLVFHGPCSLIVEGTRGVRLEAAGRGRGINQAATIGFSAGLAYAVRRSEAFGAYLIGKQELFNDSFTDGEGYYLYEEMPRDGVGGGLWGRGLQGLGDAALKVFGI
ncbi:MAG TPA: hypothetical protein VF704_05815 [Allosphingosinicella sp.]|jgi:hypothetical protein